ncbi:serine/threonine-protein kinase [Labedaea rhizosphaerae]|uniref:non-specific serine/threonine protein kinase n=1 Tax=Labedaea rhizosphaerae TaxID=598644 RepID=A0A4R6SLW8_LABRH|nr:serine/threonine-protein kinase [Labedaea rhizosphaerae]TDQ04312.1 serine/threonine protein kinase [Labedaea rhizosphaerae]
MLEIAGSLLSLAHRIFGPGLCPGDWVWGTITAGLLLGLLPVFAALLVSLVRKGTGNRYDVVTLSVFGVIGFVLVFLVPWLLATGVSEVFRSVFRGERGGLSANEVASMSDGFCMVGDQRTYLGGGPTVYDVLFHPFSGPLVTLVRIGGLVVLPALCALFVIIQARIAMRRGPKWPGRLLWIPFVLFAVLSVAIEANVATYLWLGFLPASVLGLIPLLVVGAPAWSTVERSYQRPDPAGPQQPQHPQSLQQHPGQQTHQPPVNRPPINRLPPPPTRVAGMPPQQQQRPPQQMRPPQPPAQRPPTPVEALLPPLRDPVPDRTPLAQLAKDPGPLPFAAASAAPRPTAPPSGGRFQKIRALGHGGFGTVWLAKDTHLNRTVAVKMAHAPDHETEQRMMREARALAAVHHPNCVRVYDIVEDQGELGIVMEYIEGDPLADLVAPGKPLDDLATARLWMTMAGALSAAHARGVLHRDVKPSNIILDPEGTAHLIDFGIARSQGDSTLTATGMMVGTPDFLASETAAGATATPASDAWQLAATVSFALTGHPPRGSRDNAMAALMAAAKGEPLTHLPTRSAHRALLIASLDPMPGRRPTLAVVQREMSRWLAKSGHAEEGPVTSPVGREIIEQADRTRRI